ncbi:hypothetical protein MMC22_007773 [Lobaria immixta]|nr:hypothetical protein [Lobaria immixta]
MPNPVLEHFWQGNVLVLLPTKAQYRDMPVFLQSAQALDRHGVGVVLVNAAPGTRERMPLPLKAHASTKCLSYEVRRQEGGVFQVQLPFCKDTMRPIPESSAEAISALDLLDQLEDMLASSKNLEHARYLPNIPVETPLERQKAGLPPRSRV